MKLIVGLGNKGAQYRATRHNIGFQVVDRLAEKHEVAWRPLTLFPIALYGAWRVGPAEVHLLQPQTMMNRSGDALKQAVGKWAVVPAQMLLVCDDVNLPLGTLRLRADGGAGGHNGLASCIDTLQTEAIPRLRIGVGRADLPKDLTDFVLSPFQRDEQRLLEQDIIPRAVDACELWTTEGIEKAMNYANRGLP